ncbi:multicopper oxidase family protein [Bacillus sp. AFS001701]|uniref:multicopper oxidase family protein n=1 Tax=Bacillus sp. AFS001701 TaxID=2033480 RepID=UPI002570AD31|nr:multicopper oxidase family protein [Bacillus sp. AFS001701]
MKKYLIGSAIIASVLVLGACSSSNLKMNGHDMSNMNGHEMSKMDDKSGNAEGDTKLDLKGLKEGKPLQIIRGPKVTLVAKVGKQKLKNGVVVPVWTFNGAAPGPEIRVKKGDKVKITLKNELPASVSIHWHGYPVPNNMDGIPGVTQDAIAPGKSFTYEFTANEVGTYWYHSHQDSVNQLDRGLYGAFVVEDNKKFDKDYTLMLDEWVSNKKEIANQLDAMTNPSSEKDGHSMDMSGDSSGGMMMNHSMNDYDVFTINGKSGNLIPELKVNKGDRVRLRLINAGYLTHKIHLHGHDFKVIATDGQTINKPNDLKNQLLAIAPGERYDIEFTANKKGGKWLIEEHGTKDAINGMKAYIAYSNDVKSNDVSNNSISLPSVDLSNYGQKGLSDLNLNTKYNLSYSMNLGTEMDGNEMKYTINGKTFPNIEPLNVKKGDLIKVTLKNTSMMDDHPMHLHGHFFKVLSKNGKAYSGAPIIKDTLNLKPGEEYVVAFKANNPGNWMFHCHDLHHAAAGMVSEVKYTDFKSIYTPNPDAGNMPE